MNYITQPISEMTAFLIKWLYNLLSSYGIKSMIITIIALAIFSRVLVTITKGIANALSKLVKNQTITKVIRGVGIALSFMIAVGVFLVMQNIGTYIPELKNSMFLTLSPMKLYAQDKSKLIYYFIFVGIEIFYFAFNHIIVPKIINSKPNFKMKLLSIYITSSICVTGFFLPIAILIYWAMVSFISMAITAVKLLIRKLRGKPLATPKKETEESGLVKKLNGLLASTTAKQNEVKKEKSTHEVIEVEQEPNVDFSNNKSDDGEISDKS